MQLGVLSFNMVFALVPNLLIPRQKFFKYVRIGQKLHAWQNCEQQLEVSEHIKPVCFDRLYYKRQPDFIRYQVHSDNAPSRPL